MRLSEAEERDEDSDGIPDVYEQDDPAYHLRMAEIHDRKAAEHRRIAAEIAREGKAPATDTGPRTAAEVPGGAGEDGHGPA